MTQVHTYVMFVLLQLYICSSINPHVAVGGQTFYIVLLFYIYNFLILSFCTRNANFLERVNLAEQVTSADFGVSTGLMSQSY
jgi:hypothetical protein